MIKAWRKFCGLSRLERALFAQALVLLPLTAVVLRVAGLKRWQRLLARFTPVTKASLGRADEEILDIARVTSRIIKAACRRSPYTGNCLQRSVVLWWLLGRQNIAAELRFGARKESGRIVAHAWVEVLGFALNETEDVRQRFTAFERQVSVAASRLP